MTPASGPGTVIDARPSRVARPGHAPLSEADAEVLAGRVKAVADPARLRLLSLLVAAPNGEACTSALVEPLGLSQPTVTHHLRRLAEAGIVSGERRGRWTYYRVERSALDALRAALDVGALTGAG